MENYSYSSYPGSGESSPRSREIDFDNPTPWEDQSQSPSSNYKVKFMCSYGGKIHPRPHDNQLSYIGGETKILAVDRSVKFSYFISKLSAVVCGGAVDSDVSFKYQLPGEDLDALISVTNDDDLEHMMTEYDRLYRASPKPARLRLFLFTANPPPPREGKSDQERFVDALNSGPAQQTDSTAAPVSAKGAQNNVDFLLGLDKGNTNINANTHNTHTPPPPPPAKLRDPVTESAVLEPEIRVGLRQGEGRVSSPDPHMIPVDIQRHIQDLQRLQLQDQAMYRRKGEDNFVGVHAGVGDYYVQKLPEKAPSSVHMPGTASPAVSVPATAYWPEKHMAVGGGSGGGSFPASGGGEQQVYMIPAPAGVYHAPIGRPVTGQATQEYYHHPVQRMNSDVYREQQQQQPPPYNLFTPPPPQTAAAVPHHQAAKATLVYSAGEVGYAQVAYDSAGRHVYDNEGRQVYYTAAGGGGVVPASYPAAAMAAVTPDMRVGPTAPSSQDGKIGSKVSQT